MFYTINTIDGHHVTMTGHHFLPIYDPQDKQLKTIRAFEVNINHLLIMYNRTVNIENISIDYRIGFFAPLTHTGYLLVENISTSTYAYKSFLFFIIYYKT